MKIRQKLFLTHFLTMLLIFGSVGTYLYKRAAGSVVRGVQGRLQSMAVMVGESLDANGLKGIRSKEDQALPQYQECLERLRSLKRASGDIAFMYVMRREGERVFFVADSDETAEQALPGEEYESLEPALLEGFSFPSFDEEPWTDKWGTFMSGYAPIRNGRGKYMVGVDMSAAEIGQKLRPIRLASAVALLSAVLLALLFSRWLSVQFGRAIHQLIERCMAVAKEDWAAQPVTLSGRDEFAELCAAIETMSVRIKESRTRSLAAEADLRRAKAELEARVAERTRDLSEMNDRLVREVAERLRAEEALAESARTDSLTSLMNRRALEEYMKHLVAHSRRSRRPFAVLMADIDHFKKINDTYGHHEGDRVLAGVARCLRETVRGEDLVARWGGEEFLLLLPDTGLQGGVVAAERIRKRISEQVLPAGAREHPITLSIGVAEYTSEQVLDDCIRQADAAMYEAKRLGRNRVVAAGDPAAPTSPA